MNSQTRQRRYRHVVTGLLTVCLGVAPVVSLPGQAAHAVAPQVERVPLAGVDAAASAELGLTTQASAATDGAQLAEVEAKPTTVVLTPPTDADPFDLVAVTWADPNAQAASTSVQVRVREQGTWSAWTQLATSDDGPDANTAEAANARGGSAPLLTAGADGYQVRVDSDAGSVPEGLQLDLIDAGRSAADGAAATPAASADAIGSAPAIITRAQWGADESLRTGSPSYTNDVRVGIVHHTASTNNYTAGEAASQIRAIYAYHTTTLGWADIGYNFLVDKYGRIYEGRYGGISRGVIGAHAGGYNSNSFGVSVLGNYESIEAPKAVIAAISNVMAWKMAIHAIDPTGRTPLTSAGGGTARWPAGDTRSFPTLIGHRDTGSTSCPGNGIYNKLGFVRASVQAKMFETSSPGGTSAGSTLVSGATMSEAKFLRSPNGQHVLTANGYAGEQLGLVLAGSSCPATVLKTVSRPTVGATHSNVLSMQTDGNLVLYTDGKATWSSKTAGNSGARAVLQNDRNLVVYSKAGRALFATATTTCSSVRVGAVGTGTLVSGGILKSNGYTLTMQTDGNLVLYSPRRAVWSSGSAGNAGAKLAIQNDGNAVIYSASGKVLWASNSTRAGALLSTLTLQSDGNLVMYTQSPGLAVSWASGTAGVQ